MICVDILMRCGMWSGIWGQFAKLDPHLNRTSRQYNINTSCLCCALKIRGIFLV